MNPLSALAFVDAQICVRMVNGYVWPLSAELSFWINCWKIFCGWMCVNAGVECVCVSAGGGVCMCVCVCSCVHLLILTSSMFILFELTTYRERRVNICHTYENSYFLAGGRLGPHHGVCTTAILPVHQNITNTYLFGFYSIWHYLMRCETHAKCLFLLVQRQKDDFIYQTQSHTHTLLSIPIAFPSNYFRLFLTILYECGNSTM